MSSSQARATRPTLLGIGQVLARLADEFPDLTNSKLRFLEEQGLVSPSRTKSGYRKFSQDDINRLRLILAMQRDHYLPLRVIREHLADRDAGRAATLPGAVSATVTSIIPAARRYNRDEVLRDTGATAALLSDAVSSGLIPPTETFAEDSVVVVRALVALQRSGIDPRHLRGYRQTAEREIALIENAVTPLVKRADTPSRARASELAGDIASQLDVVRSSLIRSALGRLKI